MVLRFKIYGFRDLGLRLRNQNISSLIPFAFRLIPERRGFGVSGVELPRDSN